MQCVTRLFHDLPFASVETGGQVSGHSVSSVLLETERNITSCCASIPPFRAEQSFAEILTFSAPLRMEFPQSYLRRGG